MYTMVHVYLTPTWFFGLDVIFAIIFAVITLIVSLYSFKIYKLSGQKSSKLFGEAFLLFSISYFIQSILNFAIISQLGENICEAVKIQSVTTLAFVGTYIHFIFFITGLVMLTFMTLKIKSQKTYFLILLISLSSLLISANKVYWFYTLSSLLLMFIVIHYHNNYSNNPRFRSLLVLIAFCFLFIGHIHFIFSTNYALFYALGHILELVAYVLILINLLLILKK